MKFKQKQSKLPFVITLLSALVVAGGVVAYFWLSSDKNSPNGTATERPDESSINKPDKTKSLQPAEDIPNVHEEEKDFTPSYEGKDVNSANELSGVISFKSVVGSDLAIRTTINQILGEGSCVLTLTRVDDHKTVTRKADIAQNPSSSACQGFNIPTSELGSGSWTVEIKITSGDRKGTLNDKVTL